jgi:putative FmdB family regulatory protein
VEALQKISEAPLKKCPECKKAKLKRLMSAPSFRLKGGGWYETDFKSDGEKKRNLVESSDAPPPKAAAKDGSNGAEAKSEKPKKDSGAAANDNKAPAKDSPKRPAKESPASSSGD